MERIYYGEKIILIRIVEELSSKFPDVCFIVSLGNINGKGKPVMKSRDNVHIYEYIDYGAVLPVVDYVIHHGGAGILYNAIKYNKPSVIIPHDYDQIRFCSERENSRYRYSS